MLDSIFDITHKFIVVAELIPILIAVWLYVTNISASRFFLGFSKNKIVDIIITTSEFKKDDVGGLHAVRSTTGIGQIQGISIASRLIGRLYSKKSIQIQMSGQIVHRPDKDLILLGGPAKNKITKKYLENFYEKHPGSTLKFDDINPVIELKDFKISAPDLDINNDGKVDNDYSIVICSTNPFSVEQHRLILCAGFTTYGTAGGATWLFEDVLLKGYKGIKRVKGIDKIKHPSFVAVIKVGVASGQIISTECVQIEKI